jgi:hypothetical protein
MARQEAGLVTRQLLKGSILQSWSQEARVHLDQMVLVIVRQEAGPVAWWPKTLKWELYNKSRQPKGPNPKEAEWQPKTRACLFFLLGNWGMGDVEVDVLMNENQSDSHRSMRQWFRVLGNYRTGPGLSRPTTVCPPWGGVVLTLHLSCKRGEVMMVNPDAQ